jgi:hypothetical protein
MNIPSSRLHVTPDLRLTGLRPGDQLSPETAVRLGMRLIRAAVRRAAEDEAEAPPTRRDQRGGR